MAVLVLELRRRWEDDAAVAPAQLEHALRGGSQGRPTEDGSPAWPEEAPAGTWSFAPARERAAE
ncbi:MAG TPA: hypothetical protein VL984_05480 [Acidimicrobiales bacterium]|nr:hypothetical protein [Acidimicrobiales bacterium]